MEDTKKSRTCGHSRTSTHMNSQTPLQHAQGLQKTEHDGILKWKKVDTCLLQLKKKVFPVLIALCFSPGLKFPEQGACSLTNSSSFGLQELLLIYLRGSTLHWAVQAVACILPHWSLRVSFDTHGAKWKQP